MAPKLGWGGYVLNSHSEKRESDSQSQSEQPSHEIAKREIAKEPLLSKIGRKMQEIRDKSKISEHKTPKVGESKTAYLQKISGAVRAVKVRSSNPRILTVSAPRSEISTEFSLPPDPFDNTPRFNMGRKISKKRLRRDFAQDILF